jgi:hypothetical protein
MSRISDHRTRTALSKATLTHRDRRLAVEGAVLAKYWPTVRLQDCPDGPNPGAVGTLRTQNGNVYTVFLDLKRFPDVPPPAWVVAPKLLDADGDDLCDWGVSEPMHILGGSAKKGVQICHHGEHHWTTSLTLHHVLLKVRIWLEAYEGHLAHGLPIDHWLKHH